MAETMTHESVAQAWPEAKIQRVKAFRHVFRSKKDDTLVLWKRHGGMWWCFLFYFVIFCLFIHFLGGEFNFAALGFACVFVEIYFPDLGRHDNFLTVNFNYIRGDRITGRWNVLGWIWIGIGQGVSSGVSQSCL